MSSYLQTQIVIWINQILFIVLLTLNFSYEYILISIFMLYVIGFISESTVHRYFTHKSYTIHSYLEKLFLVLSFAVGQGAILSWVTVHRTHHAFEDTEKDPHSPLYLNWFKIYLAFLPKDYNNRLIFDLLRSNNSKYFIFENKYYFYMWLVLWFVLFIISPFLLFVVVSGSAMWYIATIAVNIGTHYGIGTKRYKNAVAYNSKIINLFTGVGYHNNHHKSPKSHSYSHDRSEIDIYGYLIKKLFIWKQ